MSEKFSLDALDAKFCKTVSSTGPEWLDKDYSSKRVESLKEGLIMDIPTYGDDSIVGNNEEKIPDEYFKRILEDIKKSGIDCIAWYRSFHWLDNKYWGIYIKESGIRFIANLLADGKQMTKNGTMYKLSDYLQLAYEYIYKHEFYHFINDFGLLLLEETIDKNIFVDYFENIYCSKQSTNVEEALANAFAFDYLKKSNINPSTLRIIDAFCKSQPIGYKDYFKYMTKNDFKTGQRDLLKSIFGKNIRWSAETVYSSKLNSQDVPVKIISDMYTPGNNFGISLVTSINSYTETERFKRECEKICGRDKITEKKVNNVYSKLANGQLAGGTNFEKLKGYENIFTIRVNSNIRISLEYNKSRWYLLRIASHDDIYRNPGNILVCG